MRAELKKRIRPVLFTVGGALTGLAYWCFDGCSGTSCAIISNPLSAMAYMGVIGLLLPGVFGKVDEDGCSM